MTTKSKDVLDAALELAPSDRADLAARLIESLDETIDPDAAQAWDEEVQRRLEALDRGEIMTIAYEDGLQVLEEDERNDR